MPGKPSPFSSEQQIWIVTKYAELESVISVRRAFRKDFFDANMKAHLRKASLDLGMSVGKIWFI